MVVDNLLLRYLTITAFISISHVILLYIPTRVFYFTSKCPCDAT
jgi:hypothetical protein